MNPRSIALLSSVLVLCLLSAYSFAASRKKSVLSIPDGSVGIVAYGSLISLPSMEETLGHKYAGPIHEVHLKGYEREWTCIRPFNDTQAIAAGAKRVDAYFVRDGERVPIIGAAELNIYPRKRARINGILYRITDKELQEFDKRERGYRRVDVTDRIEEFRFRGGNVYVYVGPAGPPGASSADEGSYILMKEFRDLVTGACDLRGKKFRDEFDRSTKPCAFPILSYKDIVWEKPK